MRRISNAVSITAAALESNDDTYIPTDDAADVTIDVGRYRDGFIS